jgi:hypothetical protein
MPEGSGPTVTFTDADKQTLEGARTQLTGSGSSAPTPTVTSGRTFDQRLGLAPISERPATTDATRSQPTTELSERQKQFIEQFLRSRQKQNDNEARSIVENIVQQRNMPGNSPSIDFDRLNLLFNGEQLRRAGLEQGTFIENRLPIAPITPAIPVTSTNTATSTQSSDNIRMSREIGESSRVAAPPPTATTAPVAPPAGNETEDQIYNRLLQEQPENFRNDVDVQNDARAEARLRARAGQTKPTAPAVVARPTPQQPPPAPAPGTTHDITTGAPIGAPAAPAAARIQTPSPAATVNPADAARAREEALNATAQRHQQAATKITKSGLHRKRQQQQQL